jgi:hypothetical protein
MDLRDLKDANIQYLPVFNIRSNKRGRNTHAVPNDYILTPFYCRRQSHQQLDLYPFKLNS